MSSLFFKRILSFHYSPPTLFSRRSLSTDHPPSPSSFTVQFLVSSCGLSLPSALSAARRLRLDSSSAPNSLAVLSLLRSHGLSPSHIARIVSVRPSLLRSRPDRTLSPKLSFLSSSLPPSHLSLLLSFSPSVLACSLESHIIPAFSLLRLFLPSPDSLLLAVRRSPRLLSSNFPSTVAPNVHLLLSRGVPAPHISTLFTAHARVLTLPPARFATAVDAAARFGLHPETAMFIHAVRALNAMRHSTWDARLTFLRRSLAWSDEEIAIAFRRAPLFVLVSQEKMRKMVRFFVKEVGLTSKDLARQPKLLMYGLEKRLLPRFRVYRLLESKGLLKKDENSKKNKLRPWLFACNENEFLERYVVRYSREAPEVRDVYRSKVGVEES
ncbi:uncharacterized protein [Elaeis guineensis]|uniref:uncharacterized protein n=1 Tax=Elaeis guineensis var. tenera TaxID=51953 RepID=UPI003C6D90C3